MKRGISLLCIFFSLFCLGQEEINLFKIKKNIHDPASSFFYERLLYKYKALPLTINESEAQHLYFGRKFIKTLNLENENFKKLADAYYARDAEESIRLGKELYQMDPTNMDVLLILMFAYNQHKDQREFTMLLNQMHVLLNAITKSGDGRSQKSPYWVNTVGDGQIFLNILSKGKKFERTSKKRKDGILDIYDNENEKIFIKVLL